MLSNLLALFAELVLWTLGGQAPIRPPVLSQASKWKVLGGSLALGARGDLEGFVNLTDF